MSKEETQKILDEISALNAKLETLEKNILEKLEKISAETEKMDQHVEFVQGIYEKIKSPFHYAMNKISVLSGSQTIDK